MKKIFAKNNEKDVFFRLDNSKNTKIYDNSVSVFLGSAGSDNETGTDTYRAKIKDDALLDGYAFLNANKEDIINYGIDNGLLQRNKIYTVETYDIDGVDTYINDYTDPRDALIARDILSQSDLADNDKVEKLLRETQFDDYGIEVSERVELKSNPSQSGTLALIEAVNQWAQDNNLNGVSWDNGHALSGIIFSGKSHDSLINVVKEKPPFDYPNSVDASSIKENRGSAYEKDGNIYLSDEIYNELTRPTRKVK